ncbi:hypothetical protein [Amycolatopsis sp. NPDC003676]
MASLVSSLDDFADVEWGKFGLIDDERVPPGEPGWLALGSPDTLLTGKNGAVFRSGGTAHRAGVRLEFWDGVPPAAADRWDTAWEDRIPMTSGVVRLAFVASGVSERTLSLDGPGVYGIRALCRGRQEARRAGDLPCTGEVVEHWVLQFCSYSATPSPPAPRTPRPGSSSSRSRPAYSPRT